MIVSSDAETLDPRYATDAVSLRATRLVHAGLVRLDPDGLEPRPYLAKGWTWIDPLTLRVELRDDARFHSGAPFTAHDVVATIAAFQSKAVAARHARVVDAIGKIDEDGAHAVIVHLSHPHATLLTDLEVPILRADQAAGPADPCGAMDGLGPYVVASCAPGALSLSPAAHAALPATHAVTLRTVHDENARAMRLYAGRADVALNQISPTLLPALANDPGLSVVSRPGANLSYLVVREGRGPLDDVAVRRAISLAIDRQTLTATLLAGHAQPADGILPPALWAHTKGAPPLAYDPAAARAALASRPQPIPLTLVVSPDRLRVSIARVLAQELAAVGIEIEVVPLALGTLFSRLSAGDFDLALLVLPEITEPHVFRTFLHSAFAPPAGSNRGRVNDPELDRLIEEGGDEPSVEARRSIYAEASARVVERMHVVPLWQEDQVAVTSTRAKSFVPSAEGRWLSLAEIP